jgi:transcriptional regulator with XRE-family HTH domain
MTIKQVNRGVFASEEGRTRLETRRSELKLTYEKLSEKAGVSVSSVDRLFGQKRPVQRNTVDDITWAMNLNSIDIIDTERVAEKQQTHFTQFPSSLILGDSELKIPEELGNLGGECRERGIFQASLEDLVQADLSSEAESAVHQIALCNVEAESCEIENAALKIKPVQKSSIMQGVIKDSKVKSIKLVSVNLEVSCFE